MKNIIKTILAVALLTFTAQAGTNKVITNYTATVSDDSFDLLAKMTAILAWAKTNGFPSAGGSETNIALAGTNGNKAFVWADGAVMVTGAVRVVSGTITAAGIHTNGISVTLPDGQGNSAIILYSDAGGVNSSAPLAVFPMRFNGATWDRFWGWIYGTNASTSNAVLKIGTDGSLDVNMLNASQSSVGVTQAIGELFTVTLANNASVGAYSFVTNFAIGMDLYAAGNNIATNATNAGRLMGTNNFIDGIGRVAGKEAQIQHITLVSPTNWPVNLGGILLSKYQLRNWPYTNGDDFTWASDVIITNDVTWIDESLGNWRTVGTTHRLWEASNLGKIVKPATNGIWVYCISKAWGFTMTNDPRVIIRSYQD